MEEDLLTYDEEEEEMINQSIRNELSELLVKVESLAKDLRLKVLAGQDVLVDANELVKNVSILTFSVGELSALERNGVIASTTVVTSPTAPTVQIVPANQSKKIKYHNIRDNRGRFARVATTSSNPYLTQQSQNLFSD